MQVAIYNYMKLQMIRAKASLSTAKDLEKQGAKEPPISVDTTPLLPTDNHEPPANGYTSFR